MKKKLLFILFFYSFWGYGQGYIFYEKIESLSLTCDDGDIADGAIPCKNSISISIVNGEVKGIIKSQIGNRIDCSDNDNFELIELTPKQLFCGYTFIGGLDLSNYCYNHEVTYISIKPDNDFKILTANPGTDNTVTLITLEASSGYHELVYNWMYYDPRCRTIVSCGKKDKKKNKLR